MHWISWSVLLLCWGGSRCSDPPRGGQDGVQDGFHGDSHTKRSPPPVEPLDFGFVPSAVYATHAYYEPGAMGLLFHVVHAFLYVVQPNPFPKGETVCVCVRVCGYDKVGTPRLFLSLYLSGPGSLFPGTLSESHLPV